MSTRECRDCGRDCLTRVPHGSFRVVRCWRCSLRWWRFDTSRAVGGLFRRWHARIRPILPLGQIIDDDGNATTLSTGALIRYRKGDRVEYWGMGNETRIVHIKRVVIPRRWFWQKEIA